MWRSFNAISCGTLLVANALSVRAAFASQIYGGLEQHWMWMSTDK
jgi:hypothetical protein